MVLRLTNNATSTLAGDIDSTTTTLAIQSADAALFPALDAGDWFPVTVLDGAGNREIMKCTARVDVTLTVVRAQEGTTSKAFAAGSRIDVRLTAVVFSGSGSGLDADLLDGKEGSFYRNAANLTGTLALEQLPANVNANETAPLITDANDLFVAGTYRTGGAWTGSVFPGTTGDNQGYLRVSAWSGPGDGEELQEWFSINPAIPPYQRRFSAGIATAWVPILTANSSLNAAKLTGTIPAASFNDTAHGTRAGGSLHSAATSSVAGFMSASDKEKLSYHSINDHELRSKGLVYASDGAVWLNGDGDVAGSVWGGPGSYLTAFLANNYSRVSKSVSSGETVFPPGQLLLMVGNSSPYSVNAYVTPYNNSGEITISTGSALSGAWQVRGRITVAGGIYSYLIQRTG